MGPSWIPGLADHLRWLQQPQEQWAAENWSAVTVPFNPRHRAAAPASQHLRVNLSPQSEVALTVCPWNVLTGRSEPSLQTWMHMSVLQEAKAVLFCQSTSRAGAVEQHMVRGDTRSQQLCTQLRRLGRSNSTAKRPKDKVKPHPQCELSLRPSQTVKSVLHICRDDQRPTERDPATPQVPEAHSRSLPRRR